MSKSVRLKDYLAAELEEMAERENRSLANLVEHLLTQAIEMEKRASRRVGASGGTPESQTTGAISAPTNADAQPRDAERRTIVPNAGGSFRGPDPKGGKKR